MKPPIKGTLKEDKPPNKGQALVYTLYRKSPLKEDKPPNRGQALVYTLNRGQALVYTLYRKSPLKEDNLSTKDKMAGPEGVLIKRLLCNLIQVQEETCGCHMVCYH